MAIANPGSRLQIHCLKIAFFTLFLTLFLSMVQVGYAHAISESEAGLGLMAAETDLSTESMASGEIGTCVWEIDSQGVLTIKPQDGISGDFGKPIYGSTAPWSSYKEYITQVIVEGRVRVRSCSGLFQSYKNLVNADLSGLDTTGVTSFSSMFSSCSELRSVNFTGIDTSSATTMEYMFSYCEKLERLDLSSFDTSNVQNMSYMFNSCSALDSLNVTSFDTSNVTEMKYMFSSCSVTDIDLSSFNTSNVIGMNSMFRGCKRFERLNLSSFDFSNVVDMQNMFTNCSSLSEVVVTSFYAPRVLYLNAMFSGCSSLESLDLSSMKPVNAIRLESMFQGCGKLVSVDLRDFETPQATTMKSMFSGCKTLGVIDASSFNTSNVTDMSEMFYECTSLTSLNLSSFDTSNVTDMSSMFYKTKCLQLDLSTFNTNKVTSMKSMFEGNETLTSIDVSSFDLSSVIDMQSMFRDCSSLAAVDTSSFYAPNAEKLSSMFSGCKSLLSLDLSNLKPGNATSTASMFYRCESLVSVDLSDFDTSNVSSMASMFCYCSSLESLDLTSLNTENVTTMYQMFYACEAIRTIDLSSFDTKSVRGMHAMFRGCKKLESLDISHFDTSNVTNMSYMFYECTRLGSLDFSSFDTSKVTDVEYMFGNCSYLESVTFGERVTNIGTLPTKHKNGISNWYSDKENEWLSSSTIKNERAGIPDVYTKPRFDEVDVSFSQSSYVYRKPAVEPPVDVFYRGKRLVQGEDYEVEYFWNTDVGRDGHAYVYGKGSWTGGQYATFKIVPAHISEECVGGISPVKYTGFEVFPDVSVTVNGQKLTNQMDYIILYENNVNSGMGAIATIQGVGNYEGVVKRRFSITPAKISRLSIDPSEEAFDGFKKEPYIAVYDEYDNFLQEGRDYEIKKPDGLTDIGDYKFVINGRGNYTGTLSARFKISGKDVATLYRLWGDTALDTMVAIVDEGSFPKGGTVVLATSDGYWDALTAAGIAGLVDAPVLMTDGRSLSPQTRSQISKLKPKTIIICGGTAAVSKGVENAVKTVAGGASVVRCAGQTATGTACEIFKRGSKLGAWSDTAFVCTNNGYWDALAAAPISYARHMPIFLTEGASSISAETLSAMKSGRVRNVYIVGGTAAIKPSVQSQLEKAGITVRGRLSGLTAIETSEAVASFGVDSMGLSSNYMGVATTGGYWDALAGAALCGRKSSVLVLADGPKADSITGFMKKRADKIASVYIFGGTAAVSEATEAAAFNAAL